MSNYEIAGEAKKLNAMAARLGVPVAFGLGMKWDDWHLGVSRLAVAQMEQMRREHEVLIAKMKSEGKADGV